MTSGEEFVGEAVQGTLIARVAEPQHGEAADGHTDEKACLNCATVLVGSHCHACGQTAHVHRTLGAFFHDLLHGVLHFEGKIWRTLPLLAWNPGRLTREYIDGRRASYISPIALFLFAVFLSFALFNLDGEGAVNLNAVKAEISAPETERKARTEVARLEARLAEARAKGQEPPGLQGQLDGARESLDAIRAVATGTVPDAIASTRDPAGQRLVGRINSAWREVKANPELAAFKLQSVAYKYTWLLIPTSLPFMWLLFPFSRRFRLYDHMVFVTYSLSFMLMLLALMTLGSINAAFDWLTAPLLIYAPWHLYRQLRGTYGLSLRGTLVRLPVLVLATVFVLMMWGVTLLALVISG